MDVRSTQILKYSIVSLLISGAAFASQVDRQSPILGTAKQKADVQLKATELRCRGAEDAYQFRSRGSSGKVEHFEMSFGGSPQPAGQNSSGLAPGKCSFVDKGIANERQSVWFEAPPTAEALAKYLRSPDRYWSFFVVPASSGSSAHLQATAHQLWRKAAFVPAADSVQQVDAKSRSRVVDKAKPAQRLKHQGPQKTMAGGPTLSASPDPVIVPAGQTEVAATVSWDTGPDIPDCEIYLSIDNNDDDLFGQGHDDAKQIMIQLGSKYDFKMIVYLVQREKPSSRWHT